MNWVVYLVGCSDNSIYCGITNNIIGRLKKHNSGKGSKYTRSRLPVVLLLTSQPMDKGQALRLERKVKKQKAAAKVAYLSNYNDKAREDRI